MISEKDIYKMAWLFLDMMDCQGVRVEYKKYMLDLRKYKHSHGWEDAINLEHYGDYVLNYSDTDQCAQFSYWAILSHHINLMSIDECDVEEALNGQSSNGL